MLKCTATQVNGKKTKAFDRPLQDGPGARNLPYLQGPQCVTQMCVIPILSLVLTPQSLQPPAQTDALLDLPHVCKGQFGGFKVLYCENLGNG